MIGAIPLTAVSYTHLDVYKRQTIRYLKPQNKNANTEVPQKVSKTVEPHLQLRHSSDEWKAIWWMEDYNLSLKFLYELFFEKQQSAS